MTINTPPEWAETALRLLLAPHDRETVSGDLLEEYRENVLPSRGRLGADIWYVRQLAGFAWRANWIWAGLWSGAFVARTAVDWLLPATDFHLRSTISTVLSAGVFFGAGFFAAWRTRSPGAGIVAGVATATSGAIISLLGAMVLLAIWHDAATFAAIDGSGGLMEVFLLPVMMVVPATVLGAVGGFVGGTVQRFAMLAR